MIRVDKSLPELSFLLAKRSLLPHPLLIREVLQSLNPFVAFSWTPSPVCVSHWALLLWAVKGRITSVTLLLQPVPLAWCVAHCWLLFSSRTPGPSLPRGFPAGWLQDISVYGTVVRSAFLQPAEVPMDGSRTHMCISLVLCHLQPC